MGKPRIICVVEWKRFQHAKQCAKPARKLRNRLHDMLADVYMPWAAQKFGLETQKMNTARRHHD